MKVAGNNKKFSLGEKSNTSTRGTPCISPPLDSHLNISSLLSYSACSQHSVWVTKDGKCYGIGSNENGEISNTLRRGFFEKEEVIELKDDKNRECKFISAVCGDPYTLYHVSTLSNESNILIYCHSSICGSIPPLFVNLNSRNPIHLFGGLYTSAAVDDEGAIMVIRKDQVLSTISVFEWTTLPDSEKVVSVACCNKSVIVSSSNGNVYEASIEDSNPQGKNELVFTLVEELKGKFVIEVSGKMNNCAAVCRDGHVFGRGENYGNGRIGPTSIFTEISTLNAYKIVFASMGYFHSLFITSEQKVLACGWNVYGQCLMERPGKSLDTPIETTITSDATFCIAGSCLSIVFIGRETPPNMPNKPINTFIIKNLEKNNI